MHVFIDIVHHLVGLQGLETPLTLRIIIVFPIDAKFSFHYHSEKSDLTRQLHFLDDIVRLFIVWQIVDRRKLVMLLCGLEGEHEIFSFEVEFAAMIKHKQSREICESLMRCGSQNLCVTATAHSMMVAIYIVVSFDVVDVEEQIL